MTELNPWRPERLLDVRAVFGIDSDLQVPAFAERDEHVPEIDAVYRFDRDTTLAALGLGLDLSPFYSRCQALDLGTTAGPALLRDILQLLARPARR
jgi:hypothetical protein